MTNTPAQQTDASAQPSGPAPKRLALLLLVAGLAAAALLIGLALPQWGESSALAGESTRAAKQRAPRHGPGGKAKDSAGQPAEQKAADADVDDNFNSGGADNEDADEAGDVDRADDDANFTDEDGKVSQDPRKPEQLKKKLSEEQMNICFRKGTEPPFSGKYYRLKDPGEYRCAVCGQPLFESDTKFDSGTGWPSFWDTAFPGAVSEVEDNSHGMRRIEVTCSACGSHLGHVFPDGPEPTGLRYCINSLSLEFIPAEQLAREQAERQSASPDGGAGGAAAEQ